MEHNRSCNCTCEKGIREIELVFKSGYVVPAKVSGSLAEIKLRYLNNWFSIQKGDADKVIDINFLPE